jgi:hypothetical protein
MDDGEEVYPSWKSNLAQKASDNFYATKSLQRDRDLMYLVYGNAKNLEPSFADDPSDEEDDPVEQEASEFFKVQKKMDLRSVDTSKSEVSQVDLEEWEHEELLEEV